MQKLCNGYRLIYLTINAVLFLIVAFFSCSIYAQNTPDHSQDIQNIRALIPENWPPQYSLDSNGKPKGFAIDVMDEVAKLANIKVTYVIKPNFSQVVDALVSGEGDVIPNSGIAKERLGQFIFTSPTETFNISVFTRHDEQKIKTELGLSFHHIGVVEKNVGLFMMQERSDVKLTIYRDAQSLLLGLLSGSIDAAIYPESVFRTLARTLRVEDKIQTVGKPIREIPRGMRLLKGNEKLQLKLDKAVKAFIKTDAYAQVYTKWYGEQAPFWTEERITYAQYLFIISSALILVLGFFNYRLKKENSLKIRAEKALHETYSLFEAAIKKSPVGITILDAPDGSIRFINEAGLKIAGDGGGSDDFSIDMGNFAQAWRIRNLDGSDIIAEDIPASISLLTGKEAEKELIVSRNGTEDRILKAKSVPITDKNGTLTSVLVVYIDLTEMYEKQRRIEESQDLTRAIIDTAADGIILLSETGKIEIWNNAAKEIFGYDLTEVKGRNPHDFLVPKSEKEKGKSGLHSFLKSGELKHKNETLELTAIRKNGFEIDVELSLSSIKRLNGWNALAIIRDVSFKNKSIKSLHDAYRQMDISASKYKSLFDNAKISIWDEDFTEVYKELEKIKATGVRDIKVYLNAHLDIAFNLASKIKINDVNDETLRLYKAKTKEEFFNAVSETFSGDAIDIFIDEVDAIWHQKPSYTAKTTQRRLDGSNIYVMIHVPIPPAYEDYKNIPVSITDITGLVLAQERLEDQKSALDELQFIVDTSPAVAFLWRNEEGWPVEYVSNNVSQWGYSKEQFESKKLLFAEIVNQSDLERVGNEVARKIESNELAFTQEYRINAADGSVRWIDDRTWVRKNSAGEITHFQGVCLDITERKDTERLLWQSQKAESLGNMAGGIAHDFNNMLLPIIALADLSINQLEDDNPLKNRIVKIKDAGVQAQELVKSLMIFAREEDVQYETVEADDLLETTVDLLMKTMPTSMEIKYERRCQKVHGDPCLKCCFIGSKAQVQSVLINIAKNAADALAGQTGCLDIQCILSSALPREIEVSNAIAANEFIHIRMKDNGPGMDETVKQRIFDPFFTTKAVGEGTGMGLAMAQSIITKHQGFIKVNSRKGFGATFNIYLPLKASNE